MTVNNLTADANALLRQVAVTFPSMLTWRDQRSYMLGHVAKVDPKNKELWVRGYIRNNYLNIKRLVHLTGVSSQIGFKIKQVETTADPCPLKLGRREIEQVMSTGTAKSIVSSRQSSRMASGRGSRKGSGDDLMSGVIRKQKAVTGGKVLNPLQPGENRDDGTCEMRPDPFGAEQTYLSDDELPAGRQVSDDGMDEDAQIDTGKFDKAVKASQLNADNLQKLFEEKMQIDVLGGGAVPEDDDDDEDSEEEEDSDDAEHFIEDNKISQRHTKHTDMEGRDREDMDFPDEVETPLKDARARFQKYRGIKSLKACDWDPYENLPAEYAKIFRFQNVNGEFKQQREAVEQEGLPINGTYLTIILEIDTEMGVQELMKFNN